MRNRRRKDVHHDRKFKKLILLTFGVLAFIYLTVTLVFGKNGLLEYFELRSIRNSLLAETMISKKQNEDITNQLKSLEKDNALIEELARDYGLTKEGELIFKFKDKQ
jgi:cell division protein FtsB